jgi:ribosomal protein S18 acetylase RimI-like enzyme
MNPHEIFDLPPSARVSLHARGELAAWDRLNPLSGLHEIGHASLRPASPPEIALALHSHARDFAIKKLKFKSLKKSITDRLMAVGPYKSGEESRCLLHQGEPPRRDALPAALVPAALSDAPAIAAMLQAPFAAEDLFKPGWFNAFLLWEGERIGFGSCVRGPLGGEIIHLYLQPKWRRQGHGKSLLNALLESLRGHAPGLRALNLETRNEPALRLFESYQFRWDRDLYFNVYAK